MLNKYHYISIYLIITLLSGCYYSMSNIDKKTQIQQDQGILITKIHSNYPTSILIKNKTLIGQKDPNPTAKLSYGERTEYNMEYLDYESRLHPLKVVPIKSDDLCFVTLWGKGEADINPRCFKVDAGTITYIGDLIVDWKTNHVQMLSIDNEDETIKEAKEKYPWIFNKYKYHKKLLKIMLEETDDYKEVEEMKQLKKELKKQ